MSPLVNLYKSLKSKVMNAKIRKFNDGSLIRQKEGSDWKSVLVEATQMSLSGGIINQQKRTAVFRAPSAIIDMLDIREGADVNEVFAKAGLPKAHIYKHEATTPFYEGQEAKKNPTTNDYITDTEGNPVYLKFELVCDGDPLAKDILVQSGSSATVEVEEPARANGDLAQ